jgi:hypothetical protein
MSDTCKLCEGFETIHRHAARPIQDGTPMWCWVPSRCVYNGDDHTCPACTHSFKPVGGKPDPCFGDCGEHPVIPAIRWPKP